MDLNSLRNFELLRALSDAQLSDLSNGLSVFSAEPGDHLIRQGEPSTGCYFIEKGQVDIVIRMPGGGRLPIATVESGAFVGEFGLIDDSPRSASSIVTKAVSGYFLDRQHFLAGIAQGNDAALGLLRSFHSVLGGRIKNQIDKLEHTFNRDSTGNRTGRKKDSDMAPARSDRPHFDYRSFLHKLPIFKHHNEQQIEALAECSEFTELPRGSTLYKTGEAVDACYIVVRGSVVLFREHDDIRCQIAVLGPGRAAALAETIVGGGYQSCCETRTNVVVMRLGSQDFSRVYLENSADSRLLLNAASTELVTTISRLNNELTLHSGYKRLTQTN